MSPRNVRLSTPILALLLGNWAGCVGGIGEAPGLDDMGPGPGGVPGATQPGMAPGAKPAGTTPASKPGPVAASCAVGSTRGAGRESVRRLTKEELRATLADLLPIASKVDAAINELPDDGDYLDGFQPFYSEAQVTQWLPIADNLGGLVASDTKARAALGGDPCLGGATVAPTCWQSVLRGFMRRAFRRPVTDDEVNKLAGAATGKDVVAGTQAIVTRVLMSPDFLFRIESGGAADAARVRLTDHEVAARISYAAAGTMPDATLSAAADAGQLKDLAQVEAHVRRLIETPRAQRKVDAFFAQWVQVDGIPGPDPNVYSKWAKLPGIATSAKATYQKDITDFVDAVVWKARGTFGDVMSKRASYTSSPMLQALYGAAGPSAQGTAYATPDHAGLALRPGLLVESGLNTSPIHRGARFLQRFMCQDLPPPDPVAVAKAQQDLDNLDPRTTANYQRITAVTSNAACAACHANINATGFAFEAYDQVGRKRTVETYIEDVNGALKTDVTHPLPGTVSGVNLGADLPATYAGALDLIDAVAKSGEAAGCMSAFVMRSLEQRREGDLDRCALDEAARVLQDGRPVVDAFVKSIANEDIFWRGL